MGEVYRADDLRLGQTVALKFLPEELSTDPDRLARLQAEVRITRQVSHPNVCRVYDLSESDGLQFLTMEYVDGEDLSSLLRRIGRLPVDKGIDIARQICAGLAAAHEKGVLHRDLKPSNVMIDGAGRARLADFGIARLGADGGVPGEVVGTPAYMAPEQLAGQGASAKTDLYALGLVLYEMFAGRSPFRPASLSELIRMQAEEDPPKLSTIVPGFDPIVEKAVHRCLARDPADRPASAYALAASLPGGDPLAAALAAGETPSPEMVAAAGHVGAISPAIGLAMLAGIFAGLVTLLFTSLGLPVLTALEKPPEVLAERSREVLHTVGYVEPPTDSVFGFSTNPSYVAYLERNDPSPERWDKLRSGPAAVYFWYRQSPAHLIPTTSLRVTQNDPPMASPGMVAVALDPQGRLIELNASPQRAVAAGLTQAINWSLLFAEAGFDPTSFKATDPTRIPPSYADVRAAWEGVYPGTAFPIRIEAAAYQGRPVFFSILGPWNHPDHIQPVREGTGALAGNTATIVVLLLIIVGAGLLARRNLRLGRGDRLGAFRLALFLFIVQMLYWVFQTSHVPTLGGEYSLLMNGLAVSLRDAALLWLCYIALEPSARRLWPDMLFSWNRVLAGRWRDPRVGRDILVGALASVIVVLLWDLGDLLLKWLALPPSTFTLFSMGPLLGTRFSIGTFFLSLRHSLITVMVLFMMLLLLRVLLRRQWLAAAALVLIVSTVLLFRGPLPSPEAPLVVLAVMVGIFVQVRFGVFAMAVFMLYQNLYDLYPVTYDLTVWYRGATLFVVIVGAALAIYGYYVATAGRPLFKEGLLE